MTYFLKYQNWSAGFAEMPVLIFTERFPDGWFMPVVQRNSQQIKQEVQDIIETRIEEF